MGVQEGAAQADQDEFDRAWQEQVAVDTANEARRVTIEMEAGSAVEVRVQPLAGGGEAVAADPPNRAIGGTGGEGMAMATAPPIATTNVDVATTTAAATTATTPSDPPPPYLKPIPAFQTVADSDTQDGYVAATAAAAAMGEEAEAAFEAFAAAAATGAAASGGAGAISEEEEDKEQEVEQDAEQEAEREAELATERETQRLAEVEAKREVEREAEREGEREAQRLAGQQDDFERAWQEQVALDAVNEAKRAAAAAKYSV